jgi:D-serine deaminase-like pyridoxal phosphate-dependent protein
MVTNIQVPSLLLDEQKCRRNIATMTQKAIDNQVIIRPHFKTHQSHEIGRWFREKGVERITVSSFRMAEYFAEDGWKDITVAFPVNILEISRINTLASKIQLNLCLENLATLQFLEKNLKENVGVLIEINAGNNRSGLSLAHLPSITKLVEGLSQSKKMQFLGFLGHAGQSYHARSHEAILKAQQYSIHVMNELRQTFITDHPDLIISLGDTPTCSVADQFPGIDEMRPGNFVYYDVTQNYIGSCATDQIAVAMACPVVAKYPERNEIIVYGGGVHFSKDRVNRRDGTTIFGLIADWTKTGWTVVTDAHSYVSGLSQEHGKIRTTDARIAAIKIGDLIPIVPVHSCMTADLMKSMQTLDGRTIEMMRPY